MEAVTTRGGDKLKIDSANIGMESARTYSSETAKTVRTITAEYVGMGIQDRWADEQQDLAGSMQQTDQNTDSESNLDDITERFKNLSSASRFSASREEKDTIRSIKQQCVQFLMELLFRYRGVKKSDTDERTFIIPQTATAQLPVYRMSSMTTQYYAKEEEATTFSASGVVKIADGRELPINLEFGMSRRFEEYYQETYLTSVRSYCDPLVINLDTNVAEVSDQKFFFDLDCDGNEDEISFVKSGSGFLALDKNGDGVINDGSELFGPQSGNGFSDLAEYDSDGNGWIDEGDPIWDKLLIWTKDEDGKDQLYHLSDLGVGAIGLSNVSTQFSLNSKEDNTNNAIIRYTGVFLYENGEASTVQHLDLAR
jgi:hypothetical protein